MKEAGFTLLELSIVLVIIGLIVGGVTVGGEMIKQSELRSYVQQLETFKTAVNTYQLKYNAMPGDHRNAFDYFNGKTGCAANQVVASADSTGCNGNNDGDIDHNIGEHFKAWVHMVHGGMLQGNYTGTFASNMDYQAGVNLPVSKRGALFLIYYYHLGARQYASGFEWNMPKHRIYLQDVGGFSVSEIMGLDTKHDDGRAGTGLITVHSNSCTDQGVNGNTSAAQFLMTDPEKLCSVDWVIGK